MRLANIIAGFAAAVAALPKPTGNNIGNTIEDGEFSANVTIQADSAVCGKVGAYKLKPKCCKDTFIPTGCQALETSPLTGAEFTEECQRYFKAPQCCWRNVVCPNTIPSLIHRVAVFRLWVPLTHFKAVLLACVASQFGLGLICRDPEMLATQEDNIAAKRSISIDDVEEVVEGEDDKVEVTCDTQECLDWRPPVTTMDAACNTKECLEWRPPIQVMDTACDTKECLAIPPSRGPHWGVPWPPAAI